MNENQIEALVRQVLGNMNASAAPAAVPTARPAVGTAKVAILNKPGEIIFRDVAIPPLEDDDILVRVEGAGICGTDVHEWRGDPFSMCPVILGHEGTGEIVAMGKNVTHDTDGKPIKVGDKVVTSGITCGECHVCRMHPSTLNLCDKQSVFGLFPMDPNNPLNGWFATHLLIRGKGTTYFQVNDLTLDQRMLLEAAAVCVHALDRAKTTGLLNFNSKVVVMGCGPIGLLQCAVLRAAGINHIIAIDGAEKRLEMARKLGVKTTISFKDVPELADRVNIVKSVTDGQGADFAFQCTGAPAAAATVYDYIRRGGGLCEMGFFVNNGEYNVNPHFAMCNKEITLVGSWGYPAEDYPTTIAFLRQCREMNIPIEQLITHRFPLDKLDEAMRTNVSQAGIKICFVAD